MARKEQDKLTYPVLPLRNTIVVPKTVTPLLVGREASISAAEYSLDNDRKIICISQRYQTEIDDDPKASDLYRIGTLCTILQVLKLPDGNIRLLVEGDERIKVERFSRKKNILFASASILKIYNTRNELELEAVGRSFKRAFYQYVRLNKSIPEEALLPVNEESDNEDFFYFALANAQISIQKKHVLYSYKDLYESISKFLETLNEEIQILQLEKKIDGTVRHKLNKLQREYYLSEQLKAIHKELGISKEEQGDLIEFKKKASEVHLSEEAKRKAEEEIQKLSRLNSFSPEYSVVHSYLTWIFDLPWNEPEVNAFHLKKAQEILDEDHYGLSKVKERIIEYLAVIKIAQRVKGQILCFVGPPGVGKTSLGKSIARALDRKFVRLSLGGVRDEAEIRGHRRTYVGALPGVIIQSMKKAGTRNPLIMMDEIDKMSMDFRGDPASALLEVLDPEQNDSFRDHYLDFEYDLSQVIFITTANTLSSIPQPLIDRMEVIEIPGYTAIEKMNIAQRHMIPKVLENHEVKDKIGISFEQEAIEHIIKLYTREAGVRNLERTITKIVRKIIKEYIEEKVASEINVKSEALDYYLGVPKHLYSEVNRDDAVGVVTGLAWTAYGGETLQIEVVKMKGDGKLKLTGQLGDVMQESAQAAYSLARILAVEYGIEEDFYKKYDLHLHIPEGAIPKDGPSAGITMLTAIISILSGKKIKHDIAMTGEITLSGNVLPIGGLAEKLIAAKRARIMNVIVPKKNKPSFSEIQEEIKKDMNIIFVETIREVLQNVFVEA
jgi:ATP-dependent Lon protease